MAAKKNTVMAALAYVVFFLPLLTESKKDKYVRFHVRQGLALFILFFGFRFLTLFLLSPLARSFDPIYSGVLYLTNVALLVFFGWGVWGAIQGEKRLLPIIGAWADKHLKI